GYWTQLNNNFSKMGNMNDAQRQQQMLDWANTLNQDMSKSAQSILNKEQMNRFNQLYTQYRGYDSLLLPEVQNKLNLTEAQKRKAQTFSNEFHKEMTDLFKQFPNNRDEAMRRYNELTRQTGEQLNALLTDRQRQMWRDYIGDPFNFNQMPPQPTPR